MNSVSPDEDHLPSQQHQVSVKGNTRDYGYYDKLRASLSPLEQGKHELENDDGVANETTARTATTTTTTPFSSSTGTTRSATTAADSSLVRVTHNDFGTVRLMHLAVMFFFSRPSRMGKIAVRPEFFPNVKAALLAQYHFNNRINTVVPNLQELLTLPGADDGQKQQQCNVRLTMDVYDTGYSAGRAIQLFWDEILPRPFPYQTTAIVGPWLHRIALNLGVMSSTRNLPMISPRATGPLPDAQEGSNSGGGIKSSGGGSNLYRLFGRTIPTSDGILSVVFDFLVTETNTTHLAILEVSRRHMLDEGRQLGKLEQAARDAGIRAQVAFVDPSPRRAVGDLTKAVKFLKTTGYRHFFCNNIRKPQLQPLIEIASQEGIIGPGYFWLFGPGINPRTISDLAFPQQSTAGQALHGLALFNYGASHFRTRTNQSGFFQAVQQLDGDVEFGKHFSSKSPRNSKLVQFQENDTSFEISQGASFVYDTVMALGIAACHSNDEFFDGPELYNEFLHVNFTGASGKVQINPKTGARYPTSTSYVILNTIIVGDYDHGNGNETAKASDTIHVQSAVAFEHKPGSGWVGVSNRSGNFNYSDFSATPPPSLPPAEIEYILWHTEFLYFSCIASSVIVVALACAIWTWVCRESKVLKSSQPVFLLAICFGEILMALSAISLGIHSPPHGIEWADFACMATPWFFSMGYSVVFSALFAKTWRIYKLLGRHQSFRRVVVEPQDVILPGVCVVLSTLGILTSWQINDPAKFAPQFDENGSIDRFGRPIEVIPCCKSEGGTGHHYVLALFVIHGIATVASNIQAYRARHITTEFSESVYIAIAMAINLQALMNALPVFFVEAGPKAEYFARSIMFILLPASTLLVIFVPKVLSWRRYNREQDEKAALKKQRMERARELAIVNLYMDTAMMNSASAGRGLGNVVEQHKRPSTAADNVLEVVTFNTSSSNGTVGHERRCIHSNTSVLSSSQDGCNKLHYPCNSSIYPMQCPLKLTTETSEPGSSMRTVRTEDMVQVHQVIEEEQVETGAEEQQYGSLLVLNSQFKDAKGMAEAGVNSRRKIHVEQDQPHNHGIKSIGHNTVKPQEEAIVPDKETTVLRTGMPPVVQDAYGEDAGQVDTTGNEETRTENTFIRTKLGDEVQSVKHQCWDVSGTMETHSEELNDDVLDHVVSINFSSDGDEDEDEDAVVSQELGVGVHSLKQQCWDVLEKMETRSEELNDDVLDHVVSISFSNDGDKDEDVVVSQELEGQQTQDNTAPLEDQSGLKEASSSYVTYNRNQQAPLYNIKVLKERKRLLKQQKKVLNIYPQH